MSNRQFFYSLGALLLAIWLIVPPAAWASTTGQGEANNEEVCDPIADYYLGMEDYPQSIRRHELVVKQHPNNALAYYHLGFSYGVTGDHRAELTDYQKAVELGLSDWQLFLNMGLLYLDSGRLDDAMRGVVYWH